MVLKGSRACGFERDPWTLAMVAEFFERTFGVTYHVDHLSKFMRGPGLTRQNPGVCAKWRNERAIGRFIREEFSAIEERHAPVAAR